MGTGDVEMICQVALLTLKEYVMQQKRNDILTRSARINQFILSLLEHSWIVALIMNGNSVYNSVVDMNYHLMPICVALTYALLFGYLTFGGLKLRKKRLIFAVFLLLYDLIYFIARYEQMPRENYALQFIIGLPALYLLFTSLHRNNKLIKLLYRMENVILIFCAMSLFFWVFGTWLGILKPNTSVTINWGGIHTYKGYWGVHYNIQHDGTFGASYYRNSGIFTEAPMLNLWTNIALAIELFLKSHPSKPKVVLYCVVVGTALSTTGILFIMICVGLKFLLLYKNGKALKRLAIIGVALLVIPVGIVVGVKIMQMKMTTFSYTTRMSAYFDSIGLWFRYPLFGGGYWNVRAVVPYVNYTEVSFSNTIVAVLVFGGLWIAVLFYIPHILCMLPRFTKDKEISCFCICLFFLCCTVSYSGRYLAVVVIAIEMAFLAESRIRNSKCKQHLHSNERMLVTDFQR